MVAELKISFCFPSVKNNLFHPWNWGSIFFYLQLHPLPLRTFNFTSHKEEFYFWSVSLFLTVLSHLSGHQWVSSWAPSHRFSSFDVVSFFWLSVTLSWLLSLSLSFCHEQVSSWVLSHQCSTFIDKRNEVIFFRW